ncbi:MAG: hypothetical protein C0507_03700 [Cyanobacteria bacterium PR.3.49]|nr:hypothetical protein [Cyanobacteria bacterium PR.3.49]
MVKLKNDSMIRKIFLILSAILIAVCVVTWFFNPEKARMFMGAAMVSFACYIICYLIWGTEVEHKKH